MELKENKNNKKANAVCVILIKVNAHVNDISYGIYNQFFYINKFTCTYTYLQIKNHKKEKFNKLAKDFILPYEIL